MKPINFTRLEIFMRAIHQKEYRDASSYFPGHWEQGGWFSPVGEDSIDVKDMP